MTWNTQLYQYGNNLFKQFKLDDGIKILNQEIELIKLHLKKENAIAVLQEIPYKSNITWKEHLIFTELNKFFSPHKYSILYNISNEKQIKMTVVIAEKGLILSNPEGLNNNCCVSFSVNNTDLDVLGLHSHNAFELRGWLSTNKTFRPNVLLGDFNSGNYIKEKNDNSIAINRQNYLFLLEGFIDLCQGKYTHRIHKTHIDHIFLECTNSFLDKHKYSNVCIDRSVSLSDHYPIYCNITI